LKSRSLRKWQLAVTRRVLNPIPIAIALWAVQVLLSRAGIFHFRFLYFCLFEDDLDLDEEVEEERRR
jgi:hypothetical protein